MTDLALLDQMQLEISPGVGATGAGVGLVIASVGQLAVPVGLVTGIVGAIQENDRLRNRGFGAAAIGFGVFVAGAAIAGASIAAVEAPPATRVA
jgi:uncharacterized membrane protein